VSSPVTSSAWLTVPPFITGYFNGNYAMPHE
jgi:hypothetical protein